MTIQSIQTLKEFDKLIPAKKYFKLCIPITFASQLNKNNFKTLLVNMQTYFTCKDLSVFNVAWCTLYVQVKPASSIFCATEPARHSHICERLIISLSTWHSTLHIMFSMNNNKSFLKSSIFFSIGLALIFLSERQWQGDCNFRDTLCRIMMQRKVLRLCLNSRRKS